MIFVYTSKVVDAYFRSGWTNIHLLIWFLWVISTQQIRPIWTWILYPYNVYCLNLNILYFQWRRQAYSIIWYPRHGFFWYVPGSDFHHQVWSYFGFWPHWRTTTGTPEKIVSLQNRFKSLWGGSSRIQTLCRVTLLLACGFSKSIQVYSEFVLSDGDSVFVDFLVK